MKDRVNNKGFTLVELVVSIAVMALLAIAVGVLMSNNSIIFRKTKAEIRTQTVAEETYNDMSEMIMQAKSVKLTGYTDSDSSVKTYVKDSLADASAGTYSMNALYDANAAVGTDPYNKFYPDIIEIVYPIQQSGGTTIDCTLKYYFYRYTDGKGKSRINVYVSRECTDPAYNDIWNALTDPNSPPWNPSKYDTTYSSYDETATHINRYKAWLLTDKLQDVSMDVNYVNQSIGLNMKFSDQNRSYNSEGIVNIRNSYILNDMRVRNATVTNASPGTP